MVILISTPAMANNSGRPLNYFKCFDALCYEVKSGLKDPNEKDSEGRTLLHVAALNLKDEFRNVKLLLDRGAEVNSATPQGYTALHFAVCSRNRNVIVALIEAGASINSKDSFGRTALHFAIKRKWTDPPSPFHELELDMWILKRLLSHPEININPVDNMLETPLMCAVKDRELGVFMALLKKGANPNIPNKDNRTPLHVALLDRNPCYEMVGDLLHNGSNIYHEDKFRMSPMGILIWNVYDDESLEFAIICLRIVAFRYQIRQSLKRELETIPELSNQLNEFCKEVKLMKKVRIHGKFTLHDFGLGCFEVEVENPVQKKIYTLLVEILLTGLFSKYCKLILDRIPRPAMRRLLVGGGIAESEIPRDASNSTIYKEIRRLYYGNDKLKERVLRLKEILIKYFNISCKG